MGNLGVAILTLKNARETAYGKAMWLTIIACDILPLDKNGVPEPPSGVSVYRSPEAKAGKRITLIPKFEDNAAAPIQDEDGKIIDRSKPDPNILGNTASDGVSRIFPSAFQSIAELASVLRHERVHFAQYTGAGRLSAENSTPGERELAAYKEEQRLMDEDILKFTQDAKARQKKRLAFMIAQKERQAKAERAKIDREKGKLIAEASIVSHSKGSLKEIMDGAAKLADMMAAAAKERHLMALKQVANLACSEASNSRLLDELRQGFDELHFLPATAYPPEAAPKVYSCGEYLLWGILDRLRNGGALDLKRLRYMAADTSFGIERSNRKPLPPIVIVIPAPQPPDATFPRRDLAMNLWELASVSCETPLKVTREFFAEMLVDFPDGSNYAKIRKNVEPGCTWELFSILSEKNVKHEALDYDWLGQKVAELKSPGGGSNGGQGGPSEPNRGSWPGNGPRLNPPKF